MTLRVVGVAFIAILTKLIDPPATNRNPILKRIQIDARVAF